tara:strand:+ start:6607 stop:7641 length:1035 start_codon:yes stop_codon:yes gene_type:complete
MTMTILLSSLVALDLTHAETDVNGYVARDGAWWNGHGNRFKRYRVKQYTSRCCYRYVYQYKAWPVVVKAISYKDDNFALKALAIAGAKDKEYHALQRDALKHNQALELVKALGLEGNPNINVRYATDPFGMAAMGYRNSQYVPNAAQGNSNYGYSVNTLVKSYNALDTNVALQQLARGQEGAQATSAQALLGIKETIDLEGNHRYRVAVKLAQAELVRTQAAAQAALLKASAVPEVEVRTETKVFGSAPGAGIPLHAFSVDRLTAVIASRCSGCHSATLDESKPSKLFPDGVKMANYGTFTAEQKGRIAQLILSGDMPTKKGGGPLDVSESALFFAAWEQSKAQ